MTDKELLLEIIEASGLTTKHIVKELGITPGTWYRKLNGFDTFRQDEIEKLRRLLHLTATQVVRIFFTKRVARTATAE